jgi:Uma2 family endonuclease
LISGEHFVTPTPSQFHQEILGNLHFLIRAHIETHPVGRIYLPPFSVVLSMYDVVEPDLSYISNERLAILTPRNIRGAPDLVVEIASPGTRRRDEGAKLKLYDRFDVIEYWVVDPPAEPIRIYQRRRDRLARAGEVTQVQGHTLSTPVIPGLVLPLERVFERYAR